MAHHIAVQYNPRSPPGCIDPSITAWDTLDLLGMHTFRYFAKQLRNLQNSLATQGKGHTCGILLQLSMGRRLVLVSSASSLGRNPVTLVSSRHGYLL